MEEFPLPGGSVHERWMRLALDEALAAAEEDEVPVGAVIVAAGRVVASAHNQRERLQDPTAHAEMIALTSAFERLGAKYLPDATLFVTVEPCLMCTGALYWGKLARVVWGADDEKNGHRRVTGDAWPFHPRTTIARGVLGEEAAQLMKEFFRARR